MRKELWLTSALGFVILILLGILIFAPAKKITAPGVEGLRIDLPKTGEEISSPVKISGQVSGNGWVGFEGQVGRVQLLDYKGNVIGQTFLGATSDWTSLPVNFEANLDFTAPNEGPATLVFHNENPSGMLEKDKTFLLPVKVKKTESQEVKVYFGNLALSATSEQDECKRVYPIIRYVQKTEEVAKTALEELLKGPTEEEKSKGYFTNIPMGSKLNSISIVSEGAKADFGQTVQSGGGSCSMAGRVAQIEATLKQFPTVNSITISVDGKTGAEIFQP